MTDRADTEHIDARSTEPAAIDTGDRAIEFYWRPGCPFCMSLKRSLDRAGIELTQFNIWDDPAAAATVRSAAAGSETVPTVGLGGDYLVNPRPAEVLNLIATHNPEWARDLLADQPPKRSWFKRG